MKTIFSVFLSRLLSSEAYERALYLSLHQKFVLHAQILNELDDKSPLTINSTDHLCLLLSYSASGNWLSSTRPDEFPELNDVET